MISKVFPIINLQSDFVGEDKRDLHRAFEVTVQEKYTCT